MEKKCHQIYHIRQGSSVYIVPPSSISFRDCDATSPALYKMSSVSGAGRIKWTAKKFLFQLWSLLQLLLPVVVVVACFSLIFISFISFSLACFISLLIIFSLWCSATLVSVRLLTLCVYVPHYGSWQFNFMYWGTASSTVSPLTLLFLPESPLPAWDTKHLLKSFASVVALLAWGRLFKVLSQAWQGALAFVCVFAFAFAFAFVDVF